MCEPVYTAVIGTYAMRGSKGLYALELRNGSIRVTDTAPAHDVGYLAVHPQKRVVYATRESMIFQGRASGGIGAYEAGADGSLRLLNEVPCAGQMPCHISVCADGRTAFVSSFLNGCVSLQPLAEDGQIGPAAQVLQQQMADGIAPSDHCSIQTPDGRFLAVMNVTQHRILLYDAKQEWKEAFCLQLPGPFNYRPRHIAFHNRHAYVVTETGHTLIDLLYTPDEPQKLTQLSVKPLLPESFSGKARGSAIRVTPDGKLLIVSVRYADYLTLFPLGEDGAPGEARFIRTKGKSPRDFDISPDGAWLLAGMQNSDSVELYRIDSERGELELTAELNGIPCNTSVAFIPGEV